MIAAAWRQWRVRGVPLGAQIVALLLAGVVVAQITTLVLTVLLPPRPAPKYRMVEVARALTGGPLKTSNPRPLVRAALPQPPSLESPNWVISDQSRADLARMVGASLTDVRILFYSPLPLTGGGVDTGLASYTSSKSSEFRDQGVLESTNVSYSNDRPRLIKASMVVLADFQAGPGGPPGGFPGGGFTSLPDRMPTPSPPPSAQPSMPLPNPPAPQTQTSSQPQQAPASATAATSSPVARAAGGDPGAGVAPPQNGPGGPAQAPPSAPQPGAQATPISSPGSAASPDAHAQIVPPSSEGDSAPVFARHPMTSLGDFSSPHAAAAAESTQSRAAAIQGNVGRDSYESYMAAARGELGGFVLSPADRGGYVLPSESASGHALLGLPSTPYLQGDFVAAFQVSPGRWVTVQPAPEPFPNTWQRRIILWFFLSSILVVPVGLVFARRLAAPLANFAEAAERLGRDPSGKQASLKGPAEIGRAARAFNEMQARLQRYIDDRTAMVGAISHDLRTPLARMRFRLERIPPQFHDGMVHDIAQMEEMITSVLAFIRDVNEPSVRDRVELRSILECVVDNALLMGGDVTLSPGERVPVDVDSLGIERVLTNLVDNALKYGNKAHVRVFQDGLDVVTEIEDDGPGLPAAELERVFLPFYRSDHSRNLNKTGIGLGLAVSRSIARAHGGDINLGPGYQGLRVQLRLPRAQSYGTRIADPNKYLSG